MTFENPATVKITSLIVETGNFITFDGVTNETITPETAATQINKIFGITGQSVTTAGMKRIITQEAQDNG